MMSTHAPINSDNYHWLIRAQEDLERARITLDALRAAYDETIRAHTASILDFHKTGMALIESQKAHIETTAELRAAMDEHSDLLVEYASLQAKHDQLLRDIERMNSDHRLLVNVAKSENATLIENVAKAERSAESANRQAVIEKQTAKAIARERDAADEQSQLLASSLAALNSHRLVRFGRWAGIIKGAQ